MIWGKQRVFITGATGMVGSWLVKRLLGEGAYVVALIRDWDPQSELIRSGDVCKTSVINGCLESYATIERAINEHEIDTVFHLGAQAIVGTAFRNPLATFESNIRGTYNLLEACRVYKTMVKRVVVASSDKAYGSAEVLPYREDMPLAGRHPYDLSKRCADLLGSTYAYSYGLPVTVARCGNIYGGGDVNWRRIVPGTIRSALENKRPVLRSDGNYIRDYIYVQDVVEAYLLLAERVQEDGVRAEAFNFSLESQISVLDITNRLLQLMGRTDLEPLILNQAGGEIKNQFLDASKARGMLGWTPAFTLEQGLMETIRWYKAYFGVSGLGEGVKVESSSHGRREQAKVPLST